MSHALRPLLLIFAIAAALPVQARDGERERSSERESAGDRVRQVERDGGRVLQAEPMQRSGREVYRLKVLTPEGRVRVLDDSRRRDSRPESIDRRRYGGDDRAAPKPSERRTREPSPGRGDAAREESRGDDGADGTPNY